ncbi:MAG TPA: PQQ-dependent sugar dehydrogenase, partial [Candidatus Binatia bacterium]|nr:PQQ-dependent sugar dehydrogenase [Candidatus Binatia bacterium]
TQENLRGTVGLLDGETPYGAAGDWPGWLAAGVVAFTLARRRERRVIDRIRRPTHGAGVTTRWPLLAVALVVLACAAGPSPAAELIDEEDHALRPALREPTTERMAGLRLPPGFRIAKLAEDVGHPRMLTVAEDGTIYATRPGAGDVVALRDEDGDGRAEIRRTVVRDLSGVHDVALRGGAMYLVTVRAVYRAPMTGAEVGTPVEILGGLPPGQRHPNRTLRFGPDGDLFVSVGSTCNACVEASPESAAILRVSPDGARRALFATGLRNTIGFGWHPETKEMWGMDHGTDWLGDDFPPEELNRLREGGHYGWPFVNAGGRLLPAKTFPSGFDAERERVRTIEPVLGYTAHAAPMQMTFYTGTQFPAAYRNDAFVAMHGSWNRRPASGYEVVRVDFEGGRPVAIAAFLNGFLIEGGQATFGRPTGIAVARDGALLVADDATGVIYRITYQP